MIERKLDDIAMLDLTLQYNVGDMLMARFNFEDEIYITGRDLAIQATSDIGENAGWNVKDLRDYTQAFNDLDAQAVDVSGGDIWSLNGYDLVEAVMRRIGHHAGKVALSHVGSYDDRVRFNNTVSWRTTISETSPMPGMGRLELKDIQALSEED